jgi:hypothetical protein
VHLDSGDICVDHHGSSGCLSIQNIFWPMAMRPGSKLQGWIETGLMAIFIVGAIAIVGSAGMRCIRTLRGVPPPSQEPLLNEAGKVMLEPAAPYRCC